MKKGLPFITIVVAAVGALVVAFAPMACASKTNDAASVKKEEKSPQQDQTAEKRKALFQEAIVAVRETKSALKALDEEKPKRALAALERASGKLTIILGREPELALAPFDVKMVSYNILADIADVKALRGSIEDALDDGRIQEARRLIRNMASETVISVTNIPLATYPAAIKKAARFIDEDKVDEAKTVLQAALNTLVITDTIIPLPVVAAEQRLIEAEMLAEKTKRSKEENRHLAGLLKDARSELEFARVLGYGSKKDFKNLYEQLDQIEEKTRGGKSGIGFFDKIKGYLKDTVTSSQTEETSAKAR